METESISQSNHPTGQINQLTSQSHGQSISQSNNLSDTINTLRSFERNKTGSFYFLNFIIGNKTVGIDRSETQNPPTKRRGKSPESFSQIKQKDEGRLGSKHNLSKNI